MSEKEYDFNFMEKYEEYLAWKERRDELIPEFKEPERKLMQNSWHYEDCAQTGRIVIVENNIHPRIRVVTGDFWYEQRSCLDCGGSTEI